MAAPLPDRPAWWLAGILFGAVVVALRLALNERIGVLGGYSQVVEWAALRRGRLGWKASFLAGIALGGFAYAAAGGRVGSGDPYGWIAAAFPSHGTVATASALVLAGGLIGFGAKTAGGCTSGNGFGGTTSASPASFVATATFFSVAVAGSFVLRLLFGA